MYAHAAEHTEKLRLAVVNGCLGERPESRLEPSGTTLGLTLSALGRMRAAMRKQPTVNIARYEVQCIELFTPNM